MKPKKIIAFLFFITSFIAFAQQKEKLQKENADIKKQISVLSANLEKTQKESRLSVANLQNINQKILLREKLYRNTQREKRFIEDDIYLRQLDINRLRRELAKLRQDYSKVLVKAYKNKGVQNKVTFILSSANLGQALRRIQYLKQYSDYQDQKAEEIRGKTAEIEATIALREKAIAEKEALLLNQKKELKTINDERKEKEALIADFKKNETKITAEINQKQAQSKRLDAEIKRIIEEEIRLAKIKAEEERKKREEAERLAKIAAEKEKARIEAENKAKAEALAKQRAAAEAEAKRAEQVAAKKAEEEKQNKANEAETREAYEKARAARDKANAAKQQEAQLAKENTEAKKAAEDKIMKNYGLGNVSGSSFADNRGRLPFPVPNGQITHRFGREQHPVFKNIVIENSGIKIAVSPGTIARSVFTGEVTRILYDSSNQSKTVMVKHGNYFTVYSNLSSTSVSQGQKVATGTPIGKVGIDLDGTYTLEFQVWNGQTAIDPLGWVSH